MSDAATDTTAPRLFPCAWIPFSSRMPLPVYDRSTAEPTPTHGAILVTNNIDSRNAWGSQGHVWLVSMVHEHPDAPATFNGRTLAERYEITAFSEPGDLTLRNLTHWRPAVPEEWEYDADGLPARCIVSADPGDQGGTR